MKKGEHLHTKAAMLTGALMAFQDWIDHLEKGHSVDFEGMRESIKKDIEYAKELSKYHHDKLGKELGNEP